MKNKKYPLKSQIEALRSIYDQNPSAELERIIEEVEVADLELHGLEEGIGTHSLSATGICYQNAYQILVEIKETAKGLVPEIRPVLLELESIFASYKILLDGKASEQAIRAHRVNSIHSKSREANAPFHHSRPYDSSQQSGGYAQ